MAAHRVSGWPPSVRERDCVYLGERGEGEVVGVDLPEPVLRLAVVGGLVVALIREPGPLRLQRLSLQLRLWV